MTGLLFDPPDTAWQRPSRRYLRLSLVRTLIAWTLLFAGAATWSFLSDLHWLTWVIAASWAPWLAWRMIRAVFAFRRRGYAERDMDVYVTKGLMFRTLVCVPYGRMQLVEVNSGPLERAFRVATVRMVTSSTSGSVNIPGLDPADAAILRDRLIERGQAQQAGI